MSFEERIEKGFELTYGLITGYAVGSSASQITTHIKNLSFLAKRNWLEYCASSKISLGLKEPFVLVPAAFAKNLESLRKTQKIIKKYGEKISQKAYGLIQKNPEIVDAEKGLVSSIKKTAKGLSKEKGTSVIPNWSLIISQLHIFFEERLMNYV